MTKLCVNGSCIRIIHLDVFTSGAQEVYEVSFQFSQEWDDLVKTVTFRTDEESRSIILDSNNVCIIPWEVLKIPVQTLYVGVEGRGPDNVIIPTIWKNLRVIEPGAVSSEPSEPPTPNWFDQVMSELSKIPQIMSSDELKTILKNGVVSRKNVFMNSDRTREFWNAVQNYVDQNGGSGGGEVTTGVLSFNGRTGHVISDLGDYDHSLIGMEPLTNSQLEVILK